MAKGGRRRKGNPLALCCGYWFGFGAMFIVSPRNNALHCFEDNVRIRLSITCIADRKFSPSGWRGVLG